MKHISTLLFICISGILFSQLNHNWTHTNLDVFELAVDNNGNVYTVGRFQGTVDFDPGPASYDLTSNGAYDFYVQKLDANGNLIWVFSIGGSNAEAAKGVKVDNAGNILVFGSMSNEIIDFDPGIGIYNLDGSNGAQYLMKVDSNGNLVWAFSQDGLIEDIAIDSNNGVSLHGRFSSTRDFDPGPAVYNLTSNGGNDAFIQKVNQAGVFQWAHSFGGSNPEWSTGVSHDALDNIYLTGRFYGTVDFDPGLGVFNLSSNSTLSSNFRDAYVTKLDASGNFVWAIKFDGPGSENPSDIVSDANGNINVLVDFNQDLDVDPSAGVFTLVSGGQNRTGIVKLDNSGNFIWAKALDGLSSGYRIDLDPIGNVFACGWAYASVDFDPGPGNFNLNLGTPCTFIWQLNSAGNFNWAIGIEDMDGNGQSQPYAMVTDNSGSIYHAGFYYESVDLDPTSTSLITTSGSSGLYLQKLSSCDSYGVNQISSCSPIVWIDGQTYSTSNNTATHTIVGGAANGCDSIVTLDLTIEDVTAPVADLATLSNITAECEVTSLTAPTATDACAGSITGTHNITLPITTQGTTVVTWTYDDGNGNTSTQTQNVIIDDVTAPIADAGTLSDIVTNCGQAVNTLNPPTATDNCTGSITGTTSTTLPITSSTTITWTYDDGNGNTSTQTQNVVINVDNTAPVADVVVLANLTAECEVTNLIAPTATDNCAGTVTGTHNATLPITSQGTTVVTWTYDDGNGNTTTQTQNVVISDNTNPVADLANLADISSECEVTPTAPSATDNCVGAITGTPDLTFPITASGTTTITWTYDDGNGNTSTQTQDVIITPIDNGVTQVDAVTLSADATGYSYQWIDCDNGNQAINGETSQTFVATDNGNYAVEISNGNCAVTSSCMVINQVGISEIGNTELLKVYPNPSSGILYIESSEDIESIELVDALGKTIEVYSADLHTIDIETTPGIYFLKVTSEGTEIVVRIVKE